MDGSYVRAMDTAQRFCQLREQYKNFSFFFNATINNVNWRELPELASYVHGRFHTFLDFNLLTGNPRDALLTSPCPDDVRSTIDGIYAIRKHYAIPESLLNIYRDALLENHDKGLRFIPCRAGSLFVLVEANGNVRACPNLPVLGNLRNDSFVDIWQSSFAKKQYKNIIKEKCSCSDSCYLISSLHHCIKLPIFMIEKKIKNVLNK